MLHFSGRFTRRMFSEMLGCASSVSAPVPGGQQTLVGRIYLDLLYTLHQEITHGKNNLYQ